MAAQIFKIKKNETSQNYPNAPFFILDPYVGRLPANPGKGQCYPERINPPKIGSNVYPSHCNVMLKNPKTSIFVVNAITNEIIPVAVFNAPGDAALAIKLFNESRPKGSSITYTTNLNIVLQWPQQQ